LKTALRSTALAIVLVALTATFDAHADCPLQSDYAAPHTRTDFVKGGLVYDLTNNELKTCDGTNWNTVAAGSGLAGGTSGYLGVWTGATTMGLSSTSTSNQLFWDATNHRLGIGTANPQFTLDTVGTAAFRGNSSQVRLVETDNADPADAWHFSMNSADLTILHADASGGPYYTNAIVLKPTGNVGIGTTTPQSLLSVADTGYAQFGKTFPGAPTTADCDAVSEAGRVTIDTTNGRWYVCDGVAWKFVSIGTSGSGGSSQWTTAGSHIHYATGGVAIGQASAPEASAALEVESTTKGFLPPRLTKAQRNAIPSPAAGLMIYQSNDKRIEWFDGTSWVTFSGNLIVTNLDGTTSTTAGRSCKSLLDSGHSTGNGLYWLDPDGSSSIGAFQAYCDMSNGGWTLVTRQLSSVAASTHDVAAAVGTLTAPTQGSVAKLADSVINAIAGNSAAPVYKIDCAGRVNYYKLPSAFSATQTTWTAIQVSVVSDSVSFFTINATYAGCSKGPHSCDASSPSAWGANAGRNPGALYGAGGGFVNTNGCSYSDSTASQSAWSAGSGTTWVK
jgi:hypothetical protein